MQNPTLPMRADETPERLTGDSRVRVLPSGRSIVARVGDAGEAIEIHSPRGEMELRISLTDEGPVLSLHGASLELVSSENVSVRCKQFEIETEAGVSLRAGGDIELQSEAEIRTKTAGSTWIDGDYVQLNCRERTGYHDDPALAELPEAASADAPGPGPEEGSSDEEA